MGISERSPASTATTALQVCDACRLIQRLPVLQQGQSACCARCGASLRSRRSAQKSRSRTAAIAMAALILFWPAILCPILIVEKLGIRRESSVLGGILEMFRDAHWGMGCVVFLFSIVLPLTKLILLLELSHFRVLQRTTQIRTLKLTEHLGRWSMLDVLLLSLLVMLIKLGDLVQFQLGPAIVAFVLCVILSLTASFCFDPHAIWEE